MMIDQVEAIINASNAIPVHESVIKSFKEDIAFDDKPPKKKKSRRVAGLEASCLKSNRGRRRAQDVVMKLIENTVTAEQLQEMCCHIVPGQYEDICTERCIAGICGYPLCSNAYHDCYGTRLYIIRNNEVYDISRRRNYCSDVCFEASIIVHNQISFTPHYVREDETKEELTVIVPDRTKLRGAPGDIKDIGGKGSHDKDRNKSNSRRRRASPPPPPPPPPASRAAPDDESSYCHARVQPRRVKTAANSQSHKDNNNALNKCEIDATSYNINTDIIENCDGERSLSKTVIDAISPGHLNKTVTELTLNKHERSPGFSPQINSCNSDLDKLPIDDRPAGALQAHIVSSNRPPGSLQSDVVSSINSKLGYNLREGTCVSTTAQNIVLEVEQHLLDWVTWESYVYLLGDAYLQGLLESRGISVEGELLRQSPFSLPRYVSLCQRLQHRERLELMEEAESTAGQRPTHVMPDMERLAEDTRRMALKVKAFLSSHECDAAEEEEAVEASLPPVDQHELTGRRRNIVLEHLRRHGQDLLTGLSLSMECVHQLVATLHFTPHNIYLRPTQWRMVLLALLQLLSVRIPAVSAALHNPDNEHREVHPRLQAMGLPPHYLTSLQAALTQPSLVLSKLRLWQQQEENGGQLADITTFPVFQTAENVGRYSVIELLD